MLLAEALIERAEAQTRLDLLRERLLLVIRIQEGDTPEESPQELLAEAEKMATRIDTLVAAINATNSATPLDESRNLTDALAHRDGLLRRRRLYQQLAHKAASREERYSRSEIKFVNTMPVAELQSVADRLSREYRELDTKIQQLNWATKLVYEV